MSIFYKHILRSAFILALTWFPIMGSATGLNVFACHDEWAVLAKSLGGKTISTYVPQTQSSNSRKLKISSALPAILESSDVVICSSEFKWLSEAIKKSGNDAIASGAPGLVLVDKLVKLDPIKDGHSDHVHFNRYVHSDPNRLRAIAGQVAARFAKIDPSSSDVYRKSAKKFIQELGEIIAINAEKASALKGRTVVSDLYSYYLMKSLGLKVITSVELAEDSAASMVVRTPLGDSKQFEAFAVERDIPLVTIPFGPVLDGSDSPETFFDYFEQALARVLERF